MANELTKGITAAITATHQWNEQEAKQISTLWRYIVIDGVSGLRTGSNKIYAQDDIFRMMPEINPRFFANFGVAELTIRQKNGTQIIIQRVR